MLSIHQTFSVIWLSDTCPVCDSSSITSTTYLYHITAVKCFIIRCQRCRKWQPFTANTVFICAVVNTRILFIFYVSHCNSIDAAVLFIEITMIKLKCLVGIRIVMTVAVCSSAYTLAAGWSSPFTLHHHLVIIPFPWSSPSITCIIVICPVAASPSVSAGLAFPPWRFCSLILHFSR